MNQEYANPRFDRLRRLIGDDNLTRLNRASILICGLGGVGSWAAEAIARSGVGHIALVDFDVIKSSNANRQLPAMDSTYGKAKIEVVAQRIKDINPNCNVQPISMHLTPDNVKELLESQRWDCIIDAIDERQAKIQLLYCSQQLGLPIISSMGAGNRLDPDAIRTGDLFSSDGCPLARLLRKSLKKLGISFGITAVYSTELPILPPPSPADINYDTIPGEKQPLGSIAYITAIFGMKCAAAAINHIIDDSQFIHRGETKT